MANGHGKTENLKFNKESANLLYQPISWPSKMVVATFYSLHTGSFPTNVAKNAEIKTISLCKTRYKPHVPEIYGLEYYMQVLLLQNTFKHFSIENCKG